MYNPLFIDRGKCIDVNFKNIVVKYGKQLKYTDK